MIRMDNRHYYTPWAAPSVVETERRRTERISSPMWARIRGADASGEFETSTVIDNLSAGGFYVRLLNEVEIGARVFALFHFGHYSASNSGREVPHLAVRGRVLRVERLAGGVYGVAVRILNYRFV